MSTLAPRIVRPLLTGRFGTPYLHVAECPSTQDLLRAAGLGEGAVAVAEHQTAGRGRSGRRWSDAGGAAVLFSVLLRPPAAAPPLPQLSLVAALAVAETVGDAVGREAALKWPNDVLVDGRKVAGILLERFHDRVVCGVGVNVNQTERELPADARVAASSLRLVSGVEHDRARLLAALLAALEGRYDIWLESGLAPFRPELDRRDALRGRPVRVGAVSGEGAGIEADGRLAILTESGTRVLVESGEVVAVT